MPRNAASKKGSSSRSWKDISQEVKPKAMSSTAWKRLQVGRLKRIGLALVVAIVAIGALRFATNVNHGPRLLNTAGKELPVRHVEVVSDGVLGKEWILNQLDLDALGNNLLKIDVASVQQEFEAIPQVKRAQIEKQYPDTLFISIQEREPIARIVARNASGERLRLLVDGEGVVYEGVHYDSSLINVLPYLDIKGLKKEDGRFLKIEGLDEVGKLLSEAKSIAPHLYRSWKVVSLKDSPHIIVRSRTVKEARFEPKNYRRQLAKLDYIIDYNRSRMMGQVAKVDLTLGAQVPVKATVFTQ